ncbi:spore coat protein [Paradesulfitobacterium aromaticivorans]
MTIKLSQKERMLLQDQKTHEDTCIQKYTRYANEAQDQALKQIFTQHASHEREHFNTINQILSGQIPNMAQGQQGQQQAQQGMTAASTQAAQAGYNQNDAQMVNDMLMTEKYISGTYDTVIFESANSGVRQALNHIQKEEQQHGEDLFNYMQSHGMYNVQ